MRGKYPPQFRPGGPPTAQGKLHDMARTLVHERTHLDKKKKKMEFNAHDAGHLNKWAEREAGNWAKINHEVLHKWLKKGLKGAYKELLEQYVNPPMSCETHFKLSPKVKSDIKGPAGDM